MLNNKKSISVKIVVCLLMISLSGSFAFGAKKKKERTVKMPAWVTAPSDVFEGSKYFSAVGYGPDRDTAEVKAVSEIASIFSQSVKSDAQASKRMVQAQQDGKLASVKVESFNQKVLKKVDADNLIGVEIKEFWFDGKETWYAVAVMDKNLAAKIIEDMIRKNSSAVGELLAGAGTGEASLETFSTLDFAYCISLEDENLLNRLTVIDSSKADAIKPLCQSSKMIAVKRFDVAKSIPLYFSFDGDIDGRIETAYVAEMSKFGFISSNDKNARYVFTGVVLMDQIDSRDKKSTKCRYNLASYILDCKTGDKVLPYKISGREGHVSYDEAKSRAVKSMEKKIHSEFSDAMKDYFRNFITD